MSLPYTNHGAQLLSKALLCACSLPKESLNYLWTDENRGGVVLEEHNMELKGYCTLTG